MSRAAVFDALHGRDNDPWSVLTSPYEREKYAATLRSLSRPHYGATLEIGCSIGAMTVELALRSDRVVAVDVSAVALAAASERCAGRGVAFVRTEVPEGWPPGTFDLIVLSEVLYFLTAEEVTACARSAVDGLAPEGEIVLVNWLGETDTPLTGEAAAECFIDAARKAGLAAYRDTRTPFYRIDRLTEAARQAPG
ncbi:nodulation S family protein [Acuticoccus sp. M5D2P5]|uniref:SAM-dependent methyltransferase n=1 Tax=Acuticoccus kalidii TaxID=2910977 RepID=UPI001F464CEC|nr:SAM-dependent methyltransferase [Acuticoccus kalidii]MCF3934550.1 nodulation S family protein [Acuticoccus kalidii]